MSKSQSNKELYQFRKQHHLCVKCKQQDARTLIGKPTCFDCLEKNREYMRNKIKDKEYTDRIRENRKEKCLKENICKICGREKTTSKTLCETCLAKTRQKYKEQRLASGKILRSMAKEYGLCSLCTTKPRYLDNNTCKDCYEKVINKFKGTQKHNKFKQKIGMDIKCREWCQTP